MRALRVNRRKFIASGAAGAASLAFRFDGPLGLSRGIPRPLKNWAWLTLPEEGELAPDYGKVFPALRRARISAVLAELYDGAHAYFASQHLPVKTDLLNRMLPHAAAAEIELHAWIWSMPCSIDEILSKHPDWYNVNALGESAANKPAYVPYYKFLDPGRPEVREWVKQTVAELADIPGLAGVHLDYVRHPDAILPKGLWSKYGFVQDKVYPPYDYGYSQYERERFKETFGADPVSLKDGQLEKEWFQFRLDMVTGLVNDYLVPAAHAKGKKITAAVFPGPTLARQAVRQDWGQWNLDAFFPMLYHSFYEASPEWIRDETREGVSTVRQPVYSGLFIPGLTEADFSTCIQTALEGGASGVSLFSASALDKKKAAILAKLRD